MITDSARGRRLAWIAAGFTAGAVLIANYIRLFYGVSVGDEAYVVTMADLPALHGHWFVNDHAILQTAAMLASPFVLPYGLLFGTDGIVLYVRHLHFLLSLVVAWQAYRLLQRVNPGFVALMLSSLVVAFVPHGIATLSYNTLGSLLFGLATILAARAYLENSPRCAAASGASWVAAVFAYPTLIVPFLAFAVMGIALIGRRAQRRKTLAAPFVAALFAVSAVLVGALAWCGFDQFWSTVEYTQSVAQAGSWWKLAYAAQMVWVYLPPVWITVSLLAAWMACAVFLPEYSPWFYLLFLMAFFVLGGLYEAMPTQVLFPVAQSFVLMALISQRGKMADTDKPMMFLILIPAVFGSIATCLSSRMTLYVMCLTGFYGALAVSAMILRRNAMAGIAASLLLTGSTVYYYYGMVYEDAPIEKLDRRMESGPFAGLYTFSQKADWLNLIQNALANYDIRNKTILFLDIFPGGYMMADNIPHGPIMYFAPANFYPEVRPNYVRFFSDPSNWPEIVFDLTYYPVRPGETWVYNLPGQDPYHDPFKNFFERTGAYSVLADKGAFRILQRKGPILTR